MFTSASSIETYVADGASLVGTWSDPIEEGDTLIISVWMRSGQTNDLDTSYAGYTLLDSHDDAASWYKVADGTETTFTAAANSGTIDMIMTGLAMRSDAGETLEFVSGGHTGGNQHNNGPWNHQLGGYSADYPAAATTLCVYGESFWLVGGTMVDGTTIDVVVTDWGTPNVQYDFDDPTVGAEVKVPDATAGIPAFTATVTYRQIDIGADLVSPVIQQGLNFLATPNVSLTADLWNENLQSTWRVVGGAPADDITHPRIAHRRLTAKQMPYYLDTGLLNRGL